MRIELEKAHGLAKNLTNSSKEVFDLTWCREALKKLERKSPLIRQWHLWESPPRAGHRVWFNDWPTRLAGITGIYKLVDDILVSRNTARAGLMYRHSNSQCLQKNRWRTIPITFGSEGVWTDKSQRTRRQIQSWTTKVHSKWSSLGSKSNDQEEGNG